jgi:hypothetical protein
LAGVGGRIAWQKLISIQKLIYNGLVGTKLYKIIRPVTILYNVFLKKMPVIFN